MTYYPTITLEFKNKEEYEDFCKTVLEDVRWYGGTYFLVDEEEDE